MQYQDSGVPTPDPRDARRTRIYRAGAGTFALALIGALVAFSVHGFVGRTPTPLSAAADTPSSKYALVAIRGSELWVVDPSGSPSAPLTTDHDGEIAEYGQHGVLMNPAYLPTTDEVVLGGKRDPGATLWIFKPGVAARQIWHTDSDTSRLIGPYANGSTICVVSQSGRVFSINRATGLMRQTAALRFPGAASPASVVSASWSSAADGLAYAVSTGAGTDAFVADSDGGSAHLIARDTDPANAQVRALDFAPDGDHIVGVSRNGRALLLLDRSGKLVRQLYALPFSGEIDAAHWCPDGSSIAFSVDDTVWRLSPDGGTAVEIGTGSDPTWVPSSMLVAAMRAQGR